MKLYKKLKKIGILLIALLTLSTLSTELFAGKIKRSCTAKYSANITSIDYSNNTSKGEMDKHLAIASHTVTVGFGEGDDIKAHGSCGKLVPNRCRTRARDTLLPCVKAQAKNLNKMPKECRSNSIDKYPTQDLMSIIEKRVCKPLYTRESRMLVTTFSKPYRVHFILGVNIRGNGEGCGKKGSSESVILEGGDFSSYPITGTSASLYLPLKILSVTCR